MRMRTDGNFFQELAAMNTTFFTLQEFMTHTKGVTYVLMVVILLAMLGFWHFLVERDDDE